MILLLLLIPGLSAALFFLCRNNKINHIINVSAASLLLLCGAWLTGQVIHSPEMEYRSLGFFYMDPLGIIVLDIVLFIGFATGIYSVSYLENEIQEGVLPKTRCRLYYGLFYLFLFTMILALTVENMGIFWIAIEATTLASAFLVGFHNDKHALEAAWKYVIICSVGIAIALLGIILLHLSSIDALSEGQQLDFPALFAKAAVLKKPIVRLSFLFILIGFGTKAGLAPMHTWLPDAHSQAPSPISALLSGVLLNSAMYGIMRTVAIVNRCEGGSQYTGRLLIGAGLLSVLTAAVFILTQKDYKRLLAYSSIEHMGIVALAVGVFTPLSLFAGLFHMINHSLTKSMLFLSAGTILQKFHTKKVQKIKGLLRTLPVTGPVFFLGLFAIAGVPPFSVFASELSVILALFDAKYLYIGGVLAVLLAGIFAGIAATLFPMIAGGGTEEEEEEGEAIPVGEINKGGTAVILMLFCIICIGGFFLPDSVILLMEGARDLMLGL